MGLIRTFVAIELPAAVAGELSRLAAALAPRWPERGVRWVREGNRHLTLRFLGDTEEEKVPGLGAGLDEATADFAPFALSLEGMGCFPNSRRPRVIWVGLRDAGERLEALQRKVEELVCDRGWERERRSFRPHLTLGRVREKVRPPEGEWLEEPRPLCFEVDRVHLIKSDLQPTGAEYTSLHTAVLKET